MTTSDGPHRVRIATGSQVPARLLIHTGKPMHELTLGDLAEFTAACHEREQRTGKSHRHYRRAAAGSV